MTNHAVSNRHGSAVITLRSETEYVITRSFDAPSELVYKALTTVDLVRRWWGFETSELLVCEIDLRVGGKWRYVSRDDGMEIGFHGEYREIEEPTRLVFTEIFEGFDGANPDSEVGAAVNNVTLDENDGVTTMTVLVQHDSQEDRDTVLASGMETGMQISYNRLEDIVRRPS